ncbi:MAG TPA: hypothetical protein VE757_01865 [Gaiellaceae bacterium]|nr:hypothetical protein [Gaiellaceae bacterium]
MQGPDEPGDHDPAAIGIRRAAAALAACALTGAAGAAAQSPGRIVVLPSPFSPLRPTPPLPATAAGAETRFPGRLVMSQRVRVSVDGSGRPFRVVDVNLILMTRKGDYSFVVAGPIEDVRPARGSSAQPGLRTGAVVWQGFSPGRRALAAEITLSPRAAVSALPLRIELGPSGLRFVNTTSATAKAVDGRLPTLGVARILDSAREGLATQAAVPAPVLNATGPIRNVSVSAFVPLRVRGTVRFDGEPTRRIAAVVGRAPVRIRAIGAPKALDVSVSIPEPAAVLRPPGSQTWVDAARSGRLPGGRALTRLAVTRLLTAALALQFRQLLANPDAIGTSRTSYRYVLAQRARPVAAPDAGGGRDWVAPLAIGLGLATVAVGGLVLWAHS